MFGLIEGALNFIFIVGLWVDALVGALYNSSV